MNQHLCTEADDEGREINFRDRTAFSRFWWSDLSLRSGIAGWAFFPVRVWSRFPLLAALREAPAVFYFKAFSLFLPRAFTHNLYLPILFLDVNPSLRPSETSTARAVGHRPQARNPFLDGRVRAEKL